MPPAIRVENLGKCYRIGHASRRGAYRTLRESLMDGASAAFQRLSGRGAEALSEDFWALKDVDFEVQPGEVVGVIGRNGAGKSTLLKILSRITEPTEGRVRLRGRVGSLLEVGTGFHPELSGRENIFLNGAILGMTRREIARNFDEIVAFAEVEKFLDTPVKRYSSGMYVRLAFAVAAHLEPEILIVDEVLAVGDLSFQKKCLGKMKEVGRSGRTVLLVSHNMATIAALCQTSILMDHGRVAASGDADEQVAKYISSLNENCETPLGERSDRSGTGTTRINEISFRDARENVVDQIFCGDQVSIHLKYSSSRPLSRPSVHLAIYDNLGTPITFLSSSLTGDPINCRSAGGYLICRIPELPVAPGPYQINVCIQDDGRDVDHIAGAAKLLVNAGFFFQTGMTPPVSHGHFLCRHEWVDSPL